MTCGDTAGQWCPAIAGSTWNVEPYIGEDATAVAVFTYAGQIAVTTVVNTGQVLVGSWDHSGTSFIWSGTDILDNTYRLTFTVEADECGPLGGVHSAHGDIVQQDVGQVGVAYITRVI